ncbi:MAG TPA: ATP-binding protein [Chthoniobacterales bacterium]|nr:ATP-binding protein [Chthoniobacterales bacterium]
MASQIGTPIVRADQFIQSTRDSGYKNFASAIAELVDNALEANAEEVNIALNNGEPAGEIVIAVSDNGSGMSRHVLNRALQFGWSSHFDSRASHGRFGMGLPNASFSHARRVEVLTCHDGKKAYYAHLDVDDTVTQQATSIPSIKELSPHSWRQASRHRRGTVVFWKKCDRLSSRNIAALAAQLTSELGCIFRYQIWSGKRICVNAKRIEPFDPLFLRRGANLRGAVRFGTDLSYEVKLPNNRQTSRIFVRFSELPVAKWHSLSNEDKNRHRIAKHAGVSVVRAGREIDRGWHFMGQKRKENYDDWWRCEIRFQPDLDELFGVTNTKQTIRPTDYLEQILTPEIERIARELNGRARKVFAGQKRANIPRRSEVTAEQYDKFIAAPARKTRIKVGRGPATRLLPAVRGIRYRLMFADINRDVVYEKKLKDDLLTVTLNTRHPFVRDCWSHENGTIPELANLELLLLAAARSESLYAKRKRDRATIEQFCRSWSCILRTFLN